MASHVLIKTGSKKIRGSPLILSEVIKKSLKDLVSKLISSKKIKIPPRYIISN